MLKGIGGCKLEGSIFAEPLCDSLGWMSLMATVSAYSRPSRESVVRVIEIPTGPWKSLLEALWNGWNMLVAPELNSHTLLGLSTFQKIPKSLFIVPKRHMGLSKRKHFERSHGSGKYPLLSSSWYLTLRSVLSLGRSTFILRTSYAFSVAPHDALRKNVVSTMTLNFLICRRGPRKCKKAAWNNHACFQW